MSLNHKRIIFNMGLTYNYNVTASINLINTGNATLTFYVGVAIYENDYYGKIYRGSLQPQQVTLGPGQSQQVILKGQLQLRALLNHDGVFILAYDSQLRNVITQIPVSFTPPSPLSNYVKITNITQSGNTVYVGVINYSNRIANVYVGATEATGINGSACGLYVTGSYRDLPLQQVQIYPGGSATVEFTVDPSRYQYVVVKVWLDNPANYPAQIASRLCLDGDAIQLTQIVYSAKITQISYSNGYVYVTVKNTGNISKDYWVGATVIKAGAYSGSGCNLVVTQGPYYDLMPVHTVIPPGSSITFQIPMVNVPPGTYQVIAKVWDGYNPATNAMLPPCYDGTVSQPFTIEPAVTGTSAQITAQPS